jgi:DNA-binding transcriptional MerR regulator
MRPANMLSEFTTSTSALDSITFYCHDVHMENETQRDYSIGELADRAGVSTRTVRYYVSEGLLPPPVVAGPNSRYNDAHLERLAIINRLKEQYLPLKEIRRRLIDHTVPELHMDREADTSRSPAPASAPPSRTFLSRSSFARVAPTSGTAGLGTRNYAMPAMQETEPEYQAAISPPTPAGTTWRRIPVADGAELLISEEQYERNRDKIDWLVQWASRVLE